jgi:hypothetical protein
MTTLLTIAEVLAGEALVSPGGPIDRSTAIGDDTPLWALPAHSEQPPAAVPATVSANA